MAKRLTKIIKSDDGSYLWEDITEDGRMKSRSTIFYKNKSDCIKAASELLAASTNPEGTEIIDATGE